MEDPIQTQMPSVHVLDTSFLIGLAQHQYWAINSLPNIKRPETNVVIPNGVEYEYDMLLNDSVRRLHERLDHKPISKLLGIEKTISYEDELREALSTKLDQCVDAWGRPHGTLSRTDKTIVQAVTDYLHMGYSVSVASADWAILAEIESLELANNVSINRFSPWRKPAVNKPLDLLIAGDVYRHTDTFEKEATSNAEYIAILPSQHIGGGMHFDIALGVYTHRSYGFKLPELDGVYFLRIFDRPVEKPRQVIYDMVALRRFAIYDPNLHHKLLIAKNLNPIHRHEINRMISRRGDKFSRKEAPIEIKLALKEELVARIEDDDIGRHDKLTEGKIVQLRQRLRRINGHS